MFGPVPITGTEVMEAQEFKMKLLKAAQKKLETSSDKMVQQAFAQVSPCIAGSHTFPCMHAG